MFLDLVGAICAGAKNNSAQTMADYVQRNYPKVHIQYLGRGKKLIW